MKHNRPDISPIRDLVISNPKNVSFSLKGNGCNVFVGPQETRVLVSSTECNPKTPQGAFNDVVKTLEFALKQPLGSTTVTHPIN